VLEQTDEMTEMAAMEGPPPGTVLLDKYRVDWLLGVGGYGYVVKAQHLEHGGSVAIKIMRDDREADPATVGRFEREGRLVVQLESEHVARVHDVGKLPTGAPYMVMELLEGDDLRKLLEKGPLKITQAVDYILQACEALAEAHGRGIVHRDIKPGNLFLAKLPAKRTILKVLDFGISKSARQYDKRLTQTQSILGTPAYMSPEQMRDPRNVDPATDIWALGAVLYELVEGQLPFDADNFAELVIAVSTEPMRPMQLAPELKPVIERCLAKSVSDRFSNVAHLASALAPFGTPAIARDYVARIHRLLGHTAPPEDEGELPAQFIAARAKPPAANSELIETLPQQPAWEDEQPRRKFPWLPVALLSAVAAAGVVIAVVAFGGKESTPPPAEPKAELTKSPELTKPPEKQPEQIKPAPAPPSEPKLEAKLEPKPDPKPEPKPPVKGQQKKQPVVAPVKVVEPKTVEKKPKPGFCWNDKPVSAYFDGKCPPQK